AVLPVALGGRAGGVGADEVALDEVVGGRAAADIHPDAQARAGVAGDDVAGAGLRAADGVAGRVGDLQAVAVAQARRPGRGQADGVALDHVAGRAAIADRHPVAGVAGDDVAGPRIGAADGVVG